MTSDKKPAVEPGGTKKKKPPPNPFYLALLAIGIVFFITATAYGVMAYKALAGERGADSGSKLLLFLDQYGAWLLGAELVLLIAASVLAMATEDSWTRRCQPPEKPRDKDSPEASKRPEGKEDRCSADE